MSRFWRRFFIILGKQLIKPLKIVAAIAFMIALATLWIGTGALFSMALTNLFSIDPEVANDFGIAFAVIWPIIAVWLLCTAYRAKLQIEEENKQLIKEIKRNCE